MLGRVHTVCQQGHLYAEVVSRCSTQCNGALCKATAALWCGAKRRYSTFAQERAAKGKG
jgi:hypothetical protein